MIEQDLINFRLQNQQLVDSSFSNVTELVHYLGAVQAQEYEGGKWTIGLRIPGSKADDVEKAIRDRKIIRTWPMRGTLHYVTSEDARWMIQLLVPRVIRRMSYYFKQLELTDDVFSKARKLITKELEGGKSITRPTFYKLLEENNISTKEQRGLFILGRFAGESLICFGSKEGKQQTFVLMDEWIPNQKTIESEEAIAEITLRYFTSHGPAQIIDLAWWSGLTNTEVKKGIELNKGKLLEKKIGDRTFYMSVKLPDVKQNESSIMLLPAYDEFTIAYKDRSDLRGSGGVPEIKINDGFFSMIAKNGKIIGSWRKEIRKGKVIIQCRIHEDLSEKDMRDLKKSAEDYSEFYNIDCVIEQIKV